MKRTKFIINDIYENKYIGMIAKYVGGKRHSEYGTYKFQALFLDNNNSFSQLYRVGEIFGTDYPDRWIKL